MQKTYILGTFLFCLLWMQGPLSGQQNSLKNGYCSGQKAVQHSMNLRIGDGLRMISHDRGHTWAMAEGKAQDLPDWARRWLQAEPRPAQTHKEIAFAKDLRIKSEDGGKTWTLLEGRLGDLPYWAQPWLGAKHQPAAEAPTADNFAPQQGMISVYPNPAKDRVMLKFELEQAQDLTIEAMDLQGRSLQTWQRKATLPGSQELDLGLEDLPNGVLFIRVKGSQFKEEVRLVRMD